MKIGRTIAGVAAFGLVGVVGVASDAAAFSFPGENGRIVFNSNRSGNFDIWSMNPDGTDPTQLTDSPDFENTPNWSPDGKKILFNRQVGGTNFDIFVMDADGSNEQRLTTDPAGDTYGSFSPDGTKIAFTSGRDGNDNIFVMDADGSNQVRLTDWTGGDVHPAWSPNGDRILFASSRDGTFDLWVMDPDGTDPVQMTNLSGNPQRGAWSPDGSKIAFLRLNPARVELMDASAFATSTVLLSNANADFPAFSPDGTQITLTVNITGNSEIAIINADGSDPHFVTTHPSFDSVSRWQPIDTQAPVIVCPDPPTYLLNQSPATLTATLHDAPGGIPLLDDQVTVDVDTSSVGTHEVEVTGSDRVGNAAEPVMCSYRVEYDMVGFLAPVDNLPMVNDAKAGRAIPLKFRLLDAQGDPVTEGVTASLSSVDRPCGSDGLSDSIETYTGNSGLQNLGDGYYQWNWATPKAYAGTCRTVQLDLGESELHTAAFAFR